MSRTALLRWETDDPIHRASGSLQEDALRIRGQYHATVFREERQHQRRILLKFLRVDDVVASDVASPPWDCPLLTLPKSFDQLNLTRVINRMASDPEHQVEPFRILQAATSPCQPQLRRPA